MKRSPKILHLNTVASQRNGVGQIVGTLAKAAPDHGYESIVVAGYGDVDESDYIVQTKWQYRKNALYSRLWGEDGFLKSASTERLNEIIISQKPDIVHLHNLHGYYCDIISLDASLKRLGVPVVVTMHDLWLTTGRCATPCHIECVKPSDELCRNCCHLKSYPAKWIKGKSRLLQKNKFLQDKTVVVPSSFVSTRVESYNPLIIRNGINTKIFRPNAAVLRDKYKILAVASHWTKEKGIDDLIRLAEALPEPYKLHLIGDNVPVHHAIRKLGTIDNPEQIAAEMSTSAVVLSSSFQESFGLTVAEAIATNTPVIVRKGTAPEEMLSDASYSVDFRDTSKLVSRITGELLPQTPLFSLSSERMVGEYYELYGRLLNI